MSCIKRLALRQFCIGLRKVTSVKQYIYGPIYAKQVYKIWRNSNVRGLHILGICCFLAEPYIEMVFFCFSGLPAIG